MRSNRRYELHGMKRYMAKGTYHKGLGSEQIFLEHLRPTGSVFVDKSNNQPEDIVPA